MDDISIISDVYNIHWDQNLQIESVEHKLLQFEEKSHSYYECSVKTRVKSRKFKWSIPFSYKDALNLHNNLKNELKVNALNLPKFPIKKLFKG